ILKDLDRLRRIMNDQDRPVQIVFAGKAHPADDAGKQIIQEVFSAARDPGFGGRLAFVEDFDEQLAQYMVHGVDLWLNNPLPPLEACGTSGMKATMNGVPQLSILDGWWIEGFNGRNGWALAGSEGSDRDQWDSAQIYRILEEEVIPRYYAVNNSNGIPHEWVWVMKEAIKRSGSEFCTRRMVKEYATKFYQPALHSAEEMLRSAVPRSAPGSAPALEG
ncbi:MAG: alpha-glucan family phosphorylase, partial [Methanosarcinales archaeon]|nr:alpha-glucan family phosphorylase [Methanosarcinales archaeon]